MSVGHTHIYIIFLLSVFKGARCIVGLSHIFYITRYRTQGPFSLHHVSIPEQIKGTAAIRKHILYDERSACDCVLPHCIPCNI